MRQWFGVSAHALNSIQISCKLQKIIDSNVMNSANITKIHTPLSAKRSLPPDEHGLYKDNFVTGNAFSPPEAALLLVLTKRSALSVDENAGNGKLSKIIADIAQRDGNVLFLFKS